jgi:hypothetical protein
LNLHHNITQDNIKQNIKLTITNMIQSIRMTASFSTTSTSGTNTLQCRACNQPIKFDDKRISLKTGRKIPLDIVTNEPHNCPVWESSQQYQQAQSQPLSPSQQQQSQLQLQPAVKHPQSQPDRQRRYRICNKGCGQEIYFDASNMSQSGKWIPLEKATGLRHQCQS